jgi:hypothetical protein
MNAAFGSLIAADLNSVIVCETASPASSIAICPQQSEKISDYLRGVAAA